jgi:hypothetical protein
MGNSHRRKSAALHKFGRVWLYHSPTPVGGGVFYSFKLLPLYIPSLRIGGGGSAPCDNSLIESLHKPEPEGIDS